MNRTLRRPMFRIGGVAEGITSGLQPRQGYEGTDDPSDQRVQPLRNTRNLNDFLINFGLNMVGNAPSGNILQTAATQAKEPFGQFQQQKAYEQSSQREEKRDFMNTYMSSMAEMLGGESAANIYKHGDMAQKALDMQNQINAHNDAWSEDFTTEQAEDWDRKKRNLNIQMDNFQETTGIDMEFILSRAGGEGVQDIMDKFESVLKKDETLMVKEGKPVMDPDNPTVQLTVSEYYLDPNNAGDLKLAALKMTAKELLKMGRDLESESRDINRGWGHAKGGRAGYQQGTLVEQEDVNVMTPQGDVAMQETVEEGVEPDQLSYEELRSRLPVEITDDIVRLMVSSPEALTDFAELQTQVDVDRFNSKYGVNLVLPSEA